MVGVIGSFILPLTKSEFSRALKLGQGRGLMHVREFGLGEVRDEVIQACVKNLVFDTQCEESRTRWLVEFIDGVPEWLLEPLLHAYETSVENRDLFQMAELLCVLAQRGCGKARQALYQQFRDTEWGFLGEEELLELDGAEALLWIVEQLDSSEDIERWRLEGLVSSYDFLYGDGQGRKLIGQAPGREAKAFLARLSQPRQRLVGPRQRLEPLNAASFIEAARHKQISVGGVRFWSTRATSEELQAVATALKTTDNPEALQLFLRCFQSTGFPEYWGGLIELANHQVYEVRWLAIWVLGHHHHSDVRALALQRLEENRTAEGEFKLLVRNFEKGDTKRILAALRRLRDVDERDFHWLLGDVIEIATVNPFKENLALLAYAYEKTPCTNCRQKAVLEMHRRGDLPEWILQESKFNCDFELREKLTAGSESK